MEAAAFLRVLEPYHAAFVERGLPRRLELLRQALAPTAQICGPSTVYTGHEAISGKIDGFQRNWPDCSLAMRAAPIVFGAAAHFPMALVGPDRAVRVEGHAVVELAPDGRIQRVLAFWGDHPPLPAGWRWQTASAAASGRDPDRA